MKILNSKTERLVQYNFGKYRHNVTYKANDVNPSDVKIESLEDYIYTLMSTDVIAAPVGQLSFDGAQLTAGSIAVGDDFSVLVADLKEIIVGIEKGTEILEVPFPITESDFIV
jgi:hypothetical protein